VRKFQREAPLFLNIPEFLHATVWDKIQIHLFSRSARTPACNRQTDRQTNKQTDRYRVTANTLLSQCRAGKNGNCLRERTGSNFRFLAKRIEYYRFESKIVQHSCAVVVLRSVRCELAAYSDTVAFTAAEAATNAVKIRFLHPT